MNTARKVAVANELATRQNLYAADMNLAQQAVGRQNLRRARELLRAYEPQTAQPDLRGWEWWYLLKECRGDEVFIGPTNATRATAFVSSPLLGGVVVGCEDGSVELWDLPSRRLKTKLAKENGRVTWLATGAKAQALATKVQQGHVRIWDVSDLSDIKLLRDFGRRHPVAFLPERKWVATASSKAIYYDGAEDGSAIISVWN